MSSSAENAFLSTLDPDPVEAERKYWALRSKLVFFFRKNACIDPENLADETIERAWKRFSSGVEPYSGLNAYCHGVARHVLQEYRRRPQGQELPEDLPVQHSPAPARLSASEEGILVRQALKNLTDQDKELFTKYYLDDRDELARSENISENGLRIRIFRIRQKLLQHLTAPRKIRRRPETL